MSYAVKEIFYTLHGEGAQTGRPAVFVRFAGCSLWSGHEEDRSNATCRFCDTDFVGTDGPGGGRFLTPSELAQKARGFWPDMADARPFLVCTGGEPLLQLDRKLVDAFHKAGFEVALETNGTLAVPEGIDWICVSPKAGTKLALKSGDELKLVFPQRDMDPEGFLDLAFDHFSLQPVYGPNLEENTRQAIQYCLKHPRWRLSLQVHKLLNIP